MCRRWSPRQARRAQRAAARGDAGVSLSRARPRRRAERPVGRRTASDRLRGTRRRPPRPAVAGVCPSPRRGARAGYGAPRGHTSARRSRLIRSSPGRQVEPSSEGVGVGHHVGTRGGTIRMKRAGRLASSRRTANLPDLRAAGGDPTGDDRASPTRSPLVGPGPRRTRVHCLFATRRRRRRSKSGDVRTNCVARREAKVVGATGRARRGPRSSRAAPSGTREGAALVYSAEGRLCKVQYESCFDKEMFVSGEMSAIRGQFTGLSIELATHVW